MSLRVKVAAFLCFVACLPDSSDGGLWAIHGPRTGAPYRSSDVLRQTLSRRHKVVHSAARVCELQSLSLDESCHLEPRTVQTCKHKPPGRDKLISFSQAPGPKRA